MMAVIILQTAVLVRPVRQNFVAAAAMMVRLLTRLLSQQMNALIGLRGVEPCLFKKTIAVAFPPAATTTTATTAITTTTITISAVVEVVVAVRAVVDLTTAAEDGAAVVAVVAATVGTSLTTTLVNQNISFSFA